MAALRFLFLMGAVIAAPALAGSFNISPIRVELTGGHRTAVLTMTNEEEDPVVVQVHVLAWSQQSGEEELVDTRELLVTPPVLQIAGGKDQILRVALRREPDPAKEMTYRVVFEEVPQAAPANFSGLRVALRMSVPVFVAPVHSHATAELQWEAHSLADGRYEVAATNVGTGHLQVTDFDVQLPGAADPVRGLTAKYVLPGSRMTWILQPAGNLGAPQPAAPQPAAPGAFAPHSTPTLRAMPQPDAPIVIHGHSDQGEFTAEVASNGL
jgi:fimbrial chaperone protein